MPTLARAPSPLSALPARLPRPPWLRAGRWAAARLDRGDLGPSLLELVIWCPLNADGDGGTGPGAGDVVAALGPPAPATVTMDRGAVEALVPDRVPDMNVVGDVVEISGSVYPGAVFEGGGFFAARAVAVAGGLLIAVRTGG